MILKSACSNNPSYIDRLISVFMRSLQKMVREHLSPQAASGSTEAASGDPLGRAASGRCDWQLHCALLSCSSSFALNREILSISLTTRVKCSFKTNCF